MIVLNLVTVGVNACFCWCEDNCVNELKIMLSLIEIM